MYIYIYTSLHNHQRIWHLLLTLRSEFDSTNVALLHRSPISTLDIVIWEVLSKETCLNSIHAERSFLSAYVVLVVPSIPVAYPISIISLKSFCKYCKKSGHLIFSCSNLKANARDLAIVIQPNLIL